MVFIDHFITMPKPSIFSWIKQNKLATALIVVIIFLLARSRASAPFVGQSKYSVYQNEMVSYDMAAQMPAPASSSRTFLDNFSSSEESIGSGYDSADRKVITDTSLSLKVDDVGSVLDQINKLAVNHQGFMVNQNISRPEEGASGYISVRVQSEKLDNFLAAVRNLGVKVVSENVSGRDITEQYTNIEERLRVLNTTKRKFEEMLGSAFTVSDMLEVQRELLNLQTQIDSLEGTRRYLAESADYSLVSVYLATDEMALPYAPAESWSAKVVFRQAVRSLVLTGRGLAELGIWAVVYSPIWLAVLGIVLVARKRKKQSQY